MFLSRGGGEEHKSQVQNFKTPTWEMMHNINTSICKPKVKLYLPKNPPPLATQNQPYLDKGYGLLWPSPRRHAFIFWPNYLKFCVLVDCTNTPTRCLPFLTKALRNDFIQIFVWKWSEMHIFGSCALILRPNDLKSGTVIHWQHVIWRVVSDFLCGLWTC